MDCNAVISFLRVSILSNSIPSSIIPTLPFDLTLAEVMFVPLSATTPIISFNRPSFSAVSILIVVL